jgi:hypothetical protein
MPSRGAVRGEEVVHVSQLFFFSSVICYLHGVIPLFVSQSKALILLEQLQRSEFALCCLDVWFRSAFHVSTKEGWRYIVVYDARPSRSLRCVLATLDYLDFVSCGCKVGYYQAAE